MCTVQMDAREVAPLLHIQLRKELVMASAGKNLMFTVTPHIRSNPTD